jgi:Transposase, Mutator family
MEDDSTTAQAATLFTGEAWLDPIEAGIRERIRGFIEALFEEELTTALGRGRCERLVGAPRGYRNGTRERHLLGSFGPVQVSVPRARMADAAGGTREWRSAALPCYARMTRQVEALIAGAYLAGTNTRRVKRALAALFRGAVGKDVVSRTWGKVKADWEAWNRRDLAAEEVVRLILDGTVVRVRLDRKATNVSLLVVLGVRRDGQKLLLAVRNMGGESEAAWRSVLDDLIARGLHTPEFLLIDGGAGLERAFRAVARCAHAALHRAQASQSPGARARGAARGSLGRLHRHHLRRERKGSGSQAQGVPAQVAAEVPRRGRQPRGGRRAPVRLPAPAAEPMEVGANHQCDRAVARGVQATDQAADRVALGGNGRNAVLGVARFGPDHDAQGRRLADPRGQARRGRPA